MKIATSAAGIRQQVADALDHMVHLAMTEARQSGGRYADDYGAMM